VQGVVGAVAPPQNYNPSAASAATQATAPVVLTGNLATLYAKGTVNGDDLIGTLREIRQTASPQQRAHATWAALSTTLNGSMAYLQAGVDPTMLLQQLGSKLVLDMIKSQIGDVAMKALDQHMQAMLDDPAAWSKESIILACGSRTD
jgi:hypothetical protein